MAITGIEKLINDIQLSFPIIDIGDPLPIVTQDGRKLNISLPLHLDLDSQTELLRQCGCYAVEPPLNGRRHFLASYDNFQYEVTIEMQMPRRLSVEAICDAEPLLD